MRKAVVPTLAVATLALAGCGGDDEQASVTGTGSAPSTTAPPTFTAPPPSTVPPRTAPTPPPSGPVWCPAGKDGSPTKDGAGSFDARELLGRPVLDAETLARKHSCTVRVIRRDGKDLIRTMDYSSARINVEEQDGKVVALRGVA